MMADNESGIVNDYWEEREAAKRLNALYTHNIYVHPIGGGMVRINFGASLDEEPSYHTALVMTAENARDFACLIYGVAVQLAPEPDQDPSNG